MAGYTEDEVEQVAEALQAGTVGDSTIDGFKDLAREVLADLSEEEGEASVKKRLKKAKKLHP